MPSPFPLIAACTTQSIQEDPSSGGTVATSPRSVELAEELYPGSTLRGTLPDDERVLLAHPFVARAGATVALELDDSPQVLDLSVRGPIAAGMELGRAPLVVRGSQPVELAEAGVYLAVVEATVVGGGRYALTVACQSEECRVECDGDRPCPANALCHFVQCATTPCPSYCQVDLPAETAPPVKSQAGEPCGSRGMAPCAAQLFCAFPLEAACGEVDRPGRCQPSPATCPDAAELVCACDGRTYTNACFAHLRGLSIRAEGACPDAPTPVGLEDPGDPTPTGAENAEAGEGCMRTGCSGEICAREGNEQQSTCEMRPEYACLEKARCELQPGGDCGWTGTPDFDACMEALD